LVLKCELSLSLAAFPPLFQTHDFGSKKRDIYVITHTNSNLGTGRGRRAELGIGRLSRATLRVDTLLALDLAILAAALLFEFPNELGQLLILHHFEVPTEFLLSRIRRGGG
jgi:hypothetical protein